MANKTFKAFVDKMGGTTVTNYIGGEGELFYDPTTTTLRIGDGTTPGGTVVSGGATGIDFAEGEATIVYESLDLFIENTGDDIIISTLNGGDDIVVSAGDQVRLAGGDKALDAIQTGGTALLQAGQGSDGVNVNGGNGGAVTIRGGRGGTSTNAVSGDPGTVVIYGGYAPRATFAGGNVLIYGGDSLDGIYGDVEIGNLNQWIFSENKKHVKCPRGLLSELGDPDLVPGARAFITNCNLTAAGNFGEIAVGGGSNTVPVYSDGTEWRIG